MSVITPHIKHMRWMDRWSFEAIRETALGAGHRPPNFSCGIRLRAAGCGFKRDAGPRALGSRLQAPGSRPHVTCTCIRSCARPSRKTCIRCWALLHWSSEESPGRLVLVEVASETWKLGHDRQGMRGQRARCCFGDTMITSASLAPRIRGRVVEEAEVLPAKIDSPGRSAILARYEH